MDWSGRAPAPPAISWSGAPRQGACHVQESNSAVAVIGTHRNMPRMNPLPWSHLRPQGQTYLPLQDDKIHYAGHPVAVVVAETRAQAIYAGTLIGIEYDVDRPVVFGRTWRGIRSSSRPAGRTPKRASRSPSDVASIDGDIATAGRNRRRLGYER